MDEAKKIIIVKVPDGKEHSYSWPLFLHQLSYRDVMYHVTLTMSEGHDVHHRWLYEKFGESPCASTAEDLIALLRVDFHGFGFPQYSHDFIDQEKYGSSSIDEYISKANSAFMTPVHEIPNVKPTFWTGRIPQKVIAKRLFYIVRVRAVFRLKVGEIPFVVYKDRTPLHMSDAYFGPFPYNFLTFRDGRIVTTSFMYDKENGELYSTHYDSSGELIDSELVVSMTKEDYALFKKKYHVIKCKVLDGCYFE